MIRKVFEKIVLLLACSSALSGQKALTIYNNNLGLVYEVRQIDVPAGLGQVVFSDVPAQIKPASVQINVLKSPSTLKILSQNFEYDLVDGGRIFQKYLDQKIGLETRSRGNVQGVLLNAAGANVVLKNDDGSIQVITRTDIVTTIFPRLPQGLRTTPALIWETENKGAKRRAVEISYLTTGIGWQAEYVGVLNAAEDRLKMNGWVSINNNSGATFENVKLKVVAGDVNIAKRAPVPQMSQMHQLSRAADAGTAFQEKTFFEYHLYTLQRKETLKDRQNKQVTFIAESSTAVKKLYIYQPQVDAKRVKVKIELKNDKASGLGLPLPAGTVRLYKADADQAKLFLGEDRIAHTPSDEEISLTVGNAFDIVGERVQTGQRKLGKRKRESTYKISLRNHKKTPVQVRVIENFRGDWSISTTTLPVLEKTAEKAKWNVDIPASGKADLQFTVVQRW